MSTALLVAATTTPGAGQFLGVDWSSILLVTLVTLVATVAVVTIFSLGLRLLSTGRPDDTLNADGTRTMHAFTGTRPLPATLGGYLCVAVGAAAVLYGIYLVVPLFHMH